MFFMCSKQAHAPGAPGYGPGATGYAPGAMGNAPSAKGYAPGAPGYAPGATGYAPAARSTVCCLPKYRKLRCPRKYFMDTIYRHTLRILA